MAFAWVKINDRTPITFSNVLNLREICEQKNICKPEEINYGLTKVDINTHIKFSLEPKGVTTSDSKKTKLYYEPLELVLEFRWVKVWVASELKSGSCPYHAVLKHEKKHVSLAHNVLRLYAQKLEASLNQLNIPTKTSPEIIDNSHAVFEAKTSQYSQKIVESFVKNFRNKEKLQEIYNEIGKVWKALDSKKEYARVKNSCSKWAWPY